MIIIIFTLYRNIRFLLYCEYIYVEVVRELEVLFADRAQRFLMANLIGAEMFRIFTSLRNFFVGKSIIYMFPGAMDSSGRQMVRKGLIYILVYDPFIHCKDSSIRGSAYIDIIY